VVRRKSTHRDAHYVAPEYRALLDRLAANLRRMRAERGWTQEAAAARCADMAPYVYRRIEGGHTNLTATTLARLAAGFEVELTDLLAAAPPSTATRANPGPREVPAPEAGAPQSTVPSVRPPEGADDDFRGRLRAHRTVLLAEVGRIDAMLADLGEVPSERGSVRLQPTNVVLPPATSGRFELRGFVLALLAANPIGLTTVEMIQAAHDAGRKRIRPNDVHTVVHNLHQGEHLVRAGARGSYVYRLRPAT
jgi:transcriptional regulator with XRE-family HTH domain